MAKKSDSVNHDASLETNADKIGLGPCVTELRFHPIRKWRFDYAWPESKIAVEIEGGVWTGGRHTSGAGFVKDMEKYNEAVIHGWKLLRFTPKQRDNGEALATLQRMRKEDAQLL